MTPDAFTTSGSSPPVSDTDTTPLPPELVEALSALLAEAIVADIRQFPNLAELQRNLGDDGRVSSETGTQPSSSAPSPQRAIALASRQTG